MVLSTRLNSLGDMEKRFLTPFGTIDLTFRNASSVRSDNQASPCEIEVAGDTENWICDHTTTEFKSALLRFILGLAQRHLYDKWVKPENKDSQ